MNDRHEFFCNLRITTFREGTFSKPYLASPAQLLQSSVMIPALGDSHNDFHKAAERRLCFCQAPRQAGRAWRSTHSYEN